MLRPRHRYDRAHVGLSAGHPVTVNWQTYDTDYQVPAHDHEFYEIVLISGGTMQHTTDNGTECLNAETVLILSPASVHSYIGHKGLRLCNVLYLAEWFLADLRALRGTESLVPLFFEKAMYPRADTPPVIRLEPSASEFARLLAELNDIIWGENNAMSLLYLESCFLKLIEELIPIYHRQYGVDFMRPVRKEVQRGLEAIEMLVATHRRFSAHEVSRSAGLSLTRFDTLFREYTGISPTQYFQRHRIQHVCRRLIGTKLSIAEIAHEFDFADAAHLCRYFRRFQGISPGKYRERFGGGGASPS